MNIKLLFNIKLKFILNIELEIAKDNIITGLTKHKILVSLCLRLRIPLQLFLSLSAKADVGP